MNSERFVLYVISATSLGSLLGIIGGVTLGLWGEVLGTLVALVLASPVALIWQGMRAGQTLARVRTAKA